MSNSQPQPLSKVDSCLLDISAKWHYNLTKYAEWQEKMHKSTVILAIVLLALIASPALANGGIGLATPATTSVTLTEFPFHHEDQFRVYNNGDEDAVITIYVSAPYPDVEQWVSLEKDIFAIEAGTSTVCTFAIDAEAGYTGDYEIIFTPTKLAQELTEVPTEGGINPVAYIALGVEFKLTVHVPQEVGDSSLGERPPTPEVTPETEPPPVTEEQLIEVTETEAGVIWEELLKPILLSIPSSVVLGESVDLSASFVGGGEPAEMGLLVVSPSGKKYELPRSATFKFDELGKWSVIVTIADQAIMGKTVEVIPKQGLPGTIEPLNLLLIISICAGVIIVGMTILLVVLLRRRRL